MKRIFAVIACAIGATLAPAVASAATPTQMHVDAAYISKSGSGKQAIILIPGLASGAYVYDAVVPELSQKYTVYAVTFAGFDGEPPIQPPYLDAFDKSIVDLIAQEHLIKPIVVGHSLGGHLTFRLAEELGSTIGGAFVIDGLPIYPPPQPGETPDDRKAAAAKFRDTFLAAPQDQYAASVGRFISILVTDPKNVATISTRALRSDRATYGGAAYEYFAADLRPNLSKITVPLELVAPADTDANGAAVARIYTALCAGTPHLDVVTIAPSKHFIMYDQPDKFRATLDAFLARVATP
ncbi:MAG: alpha/beta hydrolase [Candidatus Eremiobacteraeota bacterium]|nr:alpha/beta hydrolase [Candidatus Eremiobacteraeota bacterium]